MELIMKKIAIISMFLLLPLLAACNTMEGLGQDVKKGGQNIEDTADKNK
jgi:entericidin B